MSVDLIFLGCMFGAAAIIAFYHRRWMEEKLQIEPLKRGRTTAFVEPLIPLVSWITLVIASLIIGDRSIAFTFIVKYFLSFTYISVYYVLLMILLPLLRRTISARACATLWMVPALLYLSAHLHAFEAKPLLVITLPRRWLYILFGIWISGFVGLTIWQIISHFMYRHLLLKNSEEFTDNRIRSLWNSESRRHGIKAEIPVLVSDAISTPLSIGCFSRTMRLILPMQSYTDKEIDLIFRHELRHILRLDMRTKLLINTYTAVCWFNPFAWVARRKVSEDLELSCDEAVLLGKDDATRKLYAELLLKNAGSARGNSTCLSASADSLRYRLRNTITPAKRLAGGIVVGVSLFGLIMTLGTVTIAESRGTVQSLIFDKAPPGITVCYVFSYKLSRQLGNPEATGWDEAALTDYLSSLRIYHDYARIYPRRSVYDFNVSYEDAEDSENSASSEEVNTIVFTNIAFDDGLLFVRLPYDDFGEMVFTLEDEIDWDYIDSLLDFETEDSGVEDSDTEV